MKAMIESKRIYENLVDEITTYFGMSAIKDVMSDIMNADCMVKVTRQNGMVMMYTRVEDLKNIDYDERVSMIGMVRMPYMLNEKLPREEAIDSFVVQSIDDIQYWSVLLPAGFNEW